MQAWYTASPDSFLALHAATNMNELKDGLNSVLVRALSLQSFTLYSNYFDDGHAFRVLHHQIGPGRPLPWPVRRSLSPASVFLRNHVGVSIYDLTSLEPDRESLEASPYYRDVMTVEGWGALLSVCVWEGGEPSMILTVRKPACEGDFTRDECSWIRALQPQFDVAARRVRGAESVSRSLECARRLLEQVHGSAVSLAPDGTVVLRADREEDLSGREQAVANLVARGLTNEEIAAQLCRSVNTVKSHVASALRKLGLARRIDLARRWPLMVAARDYAPRKERELGGRRESSGRRDLNRRV